MDPKRYTRLGYISFFAILLSVLVLTSGGFIEMGDGETMFRVTQNLLSGEGVAVSRETLFFPAQSYPPFNPKHDEEFPSTSAVPGRDGQTYSKYGIGQSLLAIPFYAFGALFDQKSDAADNGFYARQFSAMINAVCLAGCGLLLALIGEKLGYRKKTAWLLASAAIFTSMAWSYINNFYSQPALALLLLAAIWAAITWKTTLQSRWMWLTAIFCSLALLFRISDAIAIPAVIIYLMMVAPPSKRWNWIVPFGTSMVVALGVTLLYNWVRFCSPFETGYHEIAWTTPIIYGLYGLLFSPGKGVFLYNPALLLGLAAWPLFGKRFKPEMWLIIILWGSYLLFYAPYNFWTGGFNWGPRFLLPVVLIAFLPLGELQEQKSLRLGVPLFYLFCGIGLLIQLPAAIVDHSRFLAYQVFDIGGELAYNRTIQDFHYSPLVQQWPETLSVLQAYTQPQTWEEARKSLQALEVTGLGIQNGAAILQAEFLRRNSISFWWLNNAYLFSANPKFPVGTLLPWLFILIVSTIVLFYSGHKLSVEQRDRRHLSEER